jgi:WhiB family transcriptional regulator, redox-sensing transcriptional regulator
VTLPLQPSPVGGWKSEAACRGMPIDVFFQPTGDRDWRPDEALAVCARCPVREQCLEMALRDNEIYGVLGGTTEKARYALRQQRAKKKRTA